ncbi:hypothetical protein ACWCRF_21510 [Streptomyces sp. NPDC002405]
MKKDTLRYEQALDAVVGIPRDRARAGAPPLSYGDLSTELARRGHQVPAHEGTMPHCRVGMALNSAMSAHRAERGRFARGMTHLGIRAECGMAVAWPVELAGVKRPVVARVNPDVRGATGRDVVATGPQGIEP